MGLLVLSLLPQRRQEERRRRRAQQQELLLAESLGKHPLQNRYGGAWLQAAPRSMMLGLEGAPARLTCPPHVLSLPRWALWFFKNDKSKMWQENLRLITKFSTVEDFWA